MTDNQHPNFAPGLPVLRGTFHATVACLIPTVAATLITLWPERWAEILVVAALNFVQMVASARLHLCHHLISPRNLRWTQAVDHSIIGVSIATIAWVFGAWMPPVAALVAVHIWFKLRGPHEYTAMNAWTLGMLFLTTTVLVLQQPLSWPQKMRYAMVFGNALAAQLAFLFRWPCDGHPVWGYHEVSHITTSAIVAVLLWNVLA
jgi:hypothetical protein